MEYFDIYYICIDKHSEWISFHIANDICAGVINTDYKYLM